MGTPGTGASSRRARGGPSAGPACAMSERVASRCDARDRRHPGTVHLSRPRRARAWPARCAPWTPTRSSSRACGWKVTNVLRVANRAETERADAREVARSRRRKTYDELCLRRGANWPGTDHAQGWPMSSRQREGAAAARSGRAEEAAPWCAKRRMATSSAWCSAGAAIAVVVIAAGEQQVRQEARPARPSSTPCFRPRRPCRTRPTPSVRGDPAHRRQGGLQDQLPLTRSGSWLGRCTTRGA